MNKELCAECTHRVSCQLATTPCPRLIGKLRHLYDFDAAEATREKMHERLLRTQFEQLAFQAYLDRRSKGGLSNDLPADEAVSPEQLFWRQPDGSYGVLAFNQAWWGFQAGYELAGLVRS